MEAAAPRRHEDFVAYNKRILIVEDDHPLLETLAEQIDLEPDLQAISATTLAEAGQVIDGGRVDGVLLDVDLPDGDGRAFCAERRAQGLACPVIFLTGKDAPEDEIQGLTDGGNDYVTKPFRFDVLMARLRAHLRTFEDSEKATLRIGPYDFKPASRILLDDSGKRLRLTDKETAILRRLYQEGGKAVTREALLSEVWGYNPSVTTHTLETHIYRLRQKIEPEPARARIVVTAEDGYRLGA